MKKTLFVLGLVAAAAVFTTGLQASAFWGAKGRAASAPGQVKAFGNCEATIDRQNAKGQVKAIPGSPGEFTAITNCDHFWQQF